MRTSVTMSSRSRRPAGRGAVAGPRAGAPVARRGAVLLLTLLAAMLLAALVFYVINHGRQVNRRVVAQHAADSAVAAGAGWVARAFNTVAMNNVTMTRHLALVNALDALPRATDATRREQTPLRDALADRHPTLHTGSGRLDEIAADEFDRLLAELNDEVDLLSASDDFYTHRYDVRAMTHYEGPEGRGLIWQAMAGLDELSRNLLEELGAVAQAHAVSGGEVNLAADQSPEGTAFMVPVRPRAPWRRGAFDDFERPVRFGLLPGRDERLHAGTPAGGLGQVDDRVTNRGPFDAIFAWRRFTRESGHGTGGGAGTAPRVGGVDTGGRPNPFGGGPSNRGGGGGGGTRRIVAYTTFGTHARALEQLAAFAHGHLRFSRFEPWARQLADAKLACLWPGTPPRRFALPDWDTAYPDDVDRDPAADLPFSETGWFRLDIKSRHERRSAAFGSQGSWAFEDDPIGPRAIHARLERRRRWWLPNHRVTLDTGGQVWRRTLDPEELDEHLADVNVVPAGAQAWVYEYTYEVLFDAQIGIDPVVDQDGAMVPQTAHFVQVVIYAGVNRNPLRPGVYDPARPPRIGSGAPDDDLIPVVADPHAGFDRGAESAPAPSDLDPEQMGPDQAARRTWLTFLAVARRGDRAMIWPGRFSGNKPFGHIVAIAEAHVFNNHSWDLWTQMWHAQLRPVEAYGQWLAAMDDAAADAAESPLVSEAELADLRQYLGRLEPLAGLMLSH